MHQLNKRLFDHVVVHVKDIELSKKFYRAIVETLGHTITKESREYFFIHELEVREATVPTTAVHLAFRAENPGSVKLFHESALRAGGMCLGKPRECKDRGDYTANVMDPDGNYIEAVFKTKNQKPFSIAY